MDTAVHQLFAVGDSHCLSADWQAAEGAYREAARRSPGESAVRSKLMHLDALKKSFPLGRDDQDLRRVLATLLSGETDGDGNFEREMFLGNYVEARRQITPLPAWVFASLEGFEPCLDCLFRLEDFSTVDALCRSNPSLANGSHFCLSLWTWALIALGDRTRAFECFARSIEIFGCSESEASEFLLLDYWHAPESLISIKRILICSGEMRADKARLAAILLQAILDGIVLDGFLEGNHADRVLVLLSELLDEYPGTSAVLAHAGKKLRQKGDTFRGDDYLWRALRLIGGPNDDQSHFPEILPDLAREAARYGSFDFALCLLEGDDSDDAMEAAYECGRICEQLGRFNTAAKFYGREENGEACEEDFRRVSVRGEG